MKKALRIGVVVFCLLGSCCSQYHKYGNIVLHKKLLSCFRCCLMSSPPPPKKHNRFHSNFVCWMHYITYTLPRKKRWFVSCNPIRLKKKPLFCICCIYTHACESALMIQKSCAEGMCNAIPPFYSHTRLESFLVTSQGQGMLYIFNIFL